MSAELMSLESKSEQKQSDLEELKMREVSLKTE
jgi:hypothetical protein